MSNVIEHSFSTIAPPWIEIDLGALRRNIRSARSALTPGAELIFVVKANAYGHGIPEVARAAAEEGVRWFGVAYLKEALEIRRHNKDARILVMGVASPEDTQVMLDQNITPVVVSGEHARALADAAQKQGKTLSVHMKIDTGMGRLGFSWPDVPAALQSLAERKGLHLEGLMSHFSMVEPSEPGRAAEQYRRFDNILNTTDQPLFRHFSSSRAFLLHPEWDYDAVRSGIALYGYGAKDSDMRFHTEPILQWKAAVTQVRTVPAGTPIGYYGTYRTSAETRIAVIAAGYADGYLRTLSNRGDVLIGGRRCRVLGRVSMNWITADVGMELPVQPGDEAVLVGSQHGESIWADELASRSRTIAYEILTCIHPDLERRYRDQV